MLSVMLLVNSRLSVVKFWGLKVILKFLTGNWNAGALYSHVIQGSTIYNNIEKMPKPIG